MGAGDFSMRVRGRCVAEKKRALIEALENRQLLSVTIDVRAVDGSKAVAVSSVGQIVNLDVWVVVTGKNADPTQDGVEDVMGSFLSTGLGGASVDGNLNGTVQAPFDATASNSGQVQDLNGDGNLDVGSNDAYAATFGFFFARAGYMVGSTGPGAVVDAGSLEFKLETLTYTVTSLQQGGETDINYRPPPAGTDLSTALWTEDGSVKGGTQPGSVVIGAPVVITDPAIAPPPVAKPSSFSVQQSTSSDITPLLFDTSVISLNPASLTVTTPASHGTLALRADGSLLYAPVIGFVGSDSFAYTVSNIDGLTSNAATVTIHVAPYAPPVAGNASVTATVNVPEDISVFSTATKAAGTTLVPSLDSLVLAPTHGTVTIQPDGSILYTPLHDFVGSDSFEYTITDSNHETSNVATVSITVAGTTPPYAAQYSVNAIENTTTDFSILSVVSSQSGIAIVPTSTSVDVQPRHATATVQPDGTILYTPNEGFLGLDSLGCSIRDLNGIESNSSVVYINVILPPPPTPPVVLGYTSVTSADTPVTVSVLNGAYATTAGATLVPASVAIAAAPQHGTTVVQSNGTVIYTPTAGFSGQDQFDYTVADSNGTVSNPATIDVIVNPRVVPTAVNDTAIVKPGSALLIPVLSNDTAAVGATLNPASIAITTEPLHGTAVVQSGDVLYTPAAGFQGGDGFQYTVADNFGIVSSPATVSITVAQQLTGTVIGTPGSYRNHGTTIANVFDSNLSTFFDGPTANGNWVGLDLGQTCSINQISYAPRAGWASRMVGGVFQGSNDPAFQTGVVALATITSVPVTGVFTNVSLDNPGVFRYVRYLSPSNSYGNVAEIQFDGFPQTATIVPLIGTTIGTQGSYQNKGNTISNVFDGNLNTFFDSASPSGSWVGLDLGSAKTISQISFAPRSGFASRMVGGIFQASNSANFSTGVVNLYTITSAPPVNTLTTVTVNVTGGYHYVRYLSPANSYGNIAEMMFSADGVD